MVEDPGEVIRDEIGAGNGVMAEPKAGYSPALHQEPSWVMLSLRTKPPELEKLLSAAGDQGGVW